MALHFADEIAAVFSGVEGFQFAGSVCGTVRRTDHGARAAMVVSMTPMTKPMMDLRALVEKSADAYLIREMIGYAAGRLMELAVGAKTGTGYGPVTS